MLQDRPQWPSALQTIAPWIGATAALLIAVVLLSQFIDTLHLSIARGEALRAALAVTTASTAAIRLTDTGSHAQR